MVCVAVKARRVLLVVVVVVGVGVVEPVVMLLEQVGSVHLELAQVCVVVVVVVAVVLQADAVVV